MSGVVMIINLYFYYQISADAQSHRDGMIIIIYLFSLDKGRMMTLFYHKSQIVFLMIMLIKINLMRFNY